MKPDYFDQIRAEIRKSRKAGQIQRELYYLQALELSACASFETFKGSAAYHGWQRKNKKQINQMITDAKGYSWVHNYAAPVDEIIAQ